MKARIAKKRYKRLERTITEMHGQIRHLEWMAEREAAFRLPREGSFRRAGLVKSIDRREMRFVGMSEPPFLRIALVKRGDCLDRHLSVFSLVADVDERERITPATARFVEHSVLELLRGVWNRNYTPADEAKFEEELLHSGKKPVVEFRHGYASDAPRMSFEIVTTGPFGSSAYAILHGRRRGRDWGEPDGYHFSIQLGRRVECEVRDE